ncbi:MAG: hypothetical protein UR66_C0003G0045 [Candidatus Moranbacteria bacterium GW2011_GWE1_35_17]|nr:MAG: hypothetical protein UR66_C0003G0045 [Candidatus Moranbacteria bacterium GW2011_GWE1_35_17]KKP82860.1 MAG: hypothetical protein UR83_C0043G0002 [Candidatus Moranbacteria bacterium GW2011_GWF2_35_54]KKP84184.1 MAG: hypothetical protein UR82_C0010G0002 [Candidatus Moranbacteria bacterium GW2011_GWF1_35_5]
MKKATLKQAGKFAEIFGDASAEKLQDIFESGILSDLRDGNVAGVNRNTIRKLLGLNPLIKNVLDFLGIIDIPVTTEPFIAKEKFVVDISDEAEVQIRHIGEIFQKILLSETVFTCGPSTLRYHKLLRGAVDDDIINELGGEYVAKTNLYSMFFLMKKQGRGQDGTLLVDGGYKNKFYICDEKNVLWAISCDWNSIGWSLNADLIDDLDDWEDGDQVFSPQSS